MTMRAWCRDPKKQMVLANLTLVLGLTLPMIFHPATGLGKNVLHFVSGMMLGISITANLMRLYWMRRQGRCERE